MQVLCFVVIVEVGSNKYNEVSKIVCRSPSVGLKKRSAFKIRLCGVKSKFIGRFRNKQD